jgi:ATP-dependent Clp protease ATP-binding subunit ClpC
MFERFTDQARRVVVQAQEEARTLGHNYIGTEHILLGLLSEPDGLAARALSSLEISLDTVREQVVEIVGEGTVRPGEHIPFTPRTKKVLELSLREAQRLGDDHIGTEHILLGLVREGDGVGAQILVRQGASLDRVQAQVIATVRTAPAEELRRVSVGRMPGGAGPGVPGFRAMLTRLDEIAERLTAIENLLAEMRNPAATAARKAPSGEPEPPGGAQHQPPAGGEEPPGGPEPPGEPEPPGPPEAPAAEA